MTPTMLLETIMLRFRKLLSIYLETYPHAELEFDVSYADTHATYIKAWAGVAYLFLLRLSRSRRYVFENFRNQELIDCLSPHEVCILGGRPDRAMCTQRGYGFFWTGGIVAAMVIAWRRGNTAALRLQIRLAQKKFSNRKRYFLLWEDTLPVGVFFSLVANSGSHPTICIEHGVGTTQEILFDGTLCRYNLLYSLDQQQYIPTTTSTFFDLGPPFDVAYGSDISNALILVGTGFKGMLPDFYFKSLDLYRRFQNQFREHGWHIAYRPHPNEDAVDYSSYFERIDKSSKVECLSGSRKIFIGYISTLLFEAKTFGHGVISLTDPAMRPLAFTPHGAIDADRPDYVGDLVNHVHAEMKRTAVRRLPPVRERFMSILGRIQQLERE